ncbi:hypothetical protein LPN04_26465 [Rugamonas sp. A1-17]|nr:hypothetical protein [Rugamonas sp. A1-17]
MKEIKGLRRSSAGLFFLSGFEGKEKIRVPNILLDCILREIVGNAVACSALLQSGHCSRFLFPGSRRAAAIRLADTASAKSKKGVPVMGLLFF